MCVAVIFGGIHCVAWSFHFPSLQERLAWRISATVVGSHILVFFLATLFGIFEARFEERGGIIGTVSQSMVALPVLYVITRIVLLVLPCIALRVLTPTALIEIQWAAFFLT